MKKKPLSRAEFFKDLIKEDKDTIVDASKMSAISFIPTGSWVLNQIIGDGTMTGSPGGYPRGHITEIFGDESAGKTTLGLLAIAEAQKAGGYGILMDFEHTFHPVYAEKLGVNLSEDCFMVSQPIHFQQGARQIEKMLLMRPEILVIDSVSAMTPKQLLESDAEEAVIVGVLARLVAGLMSRISKKLQTSDTSLIFLNQLRSVIKKSKWDTGPDEESTGGRSLKYFSSIRIKLKTSKVEKIDIVSKVTGKKEKEPVNVLVKATVVKSKIDIPKRSGPVYIRFGEGVDNILSVIELAINLRVIKKNGSFFVFDTIKVQGKDNFRSAMNENPKIFEKLQNSLVIKEDEQAKEEYKDVDDDIPPDEVDDFYDNIAEEFIDKELKKKEQKKNKDSGEDE